jgi:hypothetical protein
MKEQGKGRLHTGPRTMPCVEALIKLLEGMGGGFLSGDCASSLSRSSDPGRVK